MVDFQTIHDRKNTRSFKWDEIKKVFNSEEVLPMWVADMDFKAPDAVNEALKARAEHGIYGYTAIGDDIKQLVTSWIEEKHGWQVESDWLTFSPGVITSLHMAIQSFTEPNEEIVIQTPVYTPFFNLIKNGGRTIVENPLIKKEDTYEIDFVDLEAKFKAGAKTFIFCSPHNPTGRVWTKEELEKIGGLCLKYDVLILADEIHADIILPGHKHIPIASISEAIKEQTITCLSPTKTFNLAGLQVSYLVTANKEKRAQLSQELGLAGFNMLNTMGILALEAAYRDGDTWLKEFIEVIADNKAYAKQTLEAESNGKLKVIDSDGTYLLWIDCQRLGLDDKALQQFMIEEAKVGLNAGSSYGKQGEQFMRMNLACPKETVVEGVGRIIKAIQA